MENPLQEYRLKRNITERQLADELGITQQFLNRFLNGNHVGIKAQLVHRIHTITKIPYAKIIEYCVYISEKNGEAA